MDQFLMKPKLLNEYMQPYNENNQNKYKENNPSNQLINQITNMNINQENK